MPLRSTRDLTPDQIQFLKTVVWSYELQEFADQFNLPYQYCLEMRQFVSKQLFDRTGERLPHLRFKRTVFPSKKPRPDLNIKKPPIETRVRHVPKPFARPSWFDEDLNALTKGGFEFTKPI